MQRSPGRQFGHTVPVGLTRVLACRRGDTSRATRRGKTRTRRRCCWWRDSQAASCGGYAMPRRSRSHARRTTTGVLALLTWSNEGIFTVLDTRCLLWCVSRGTLSSRNCRHISGSLSRHTLAPFPLRSRQVSTYHWPWRWYFCGVHCGRRPPASSPSLDTWALPHLPWSWAWTRRSSGGACSAGDAGTSVGITTGGARHRGGGHGPLRACSPHPQC